MRLALVGLVVMLGCKEKPNNQPVAPQPAGGSNRTQPAAPPAQGHVLVLPKRSGTPPVKTTKPLTPERAEALAKLEYPGFKTDVRNKDEKGLDIRYKTVNRPKIAVTLTVQPCFKCEPMELDKWQKHKDALRELLPKELVHLSDTIFELGKTELAGQPIIYQYQVGYLKGSDPGGFAMTAYSNAYGLYYNDGTNMIRVVAEYKDDPPGSREDMLRMVPREDLEAIALAFLDAYTHAW